MQHGLRTVLLTVVGAAIGSAIGAVPGFFIGGLLGFVVAREMTLRQRLRELEQAEVRLSEQRVWADQMKVWSKGASEWINRHGAEAEDAPTEKTIEPTTQEVTADEIAAQETAADEIAAQETTADEIAAQETAADEIAAQETTADEIAAQETAADEIAAQETTADEIAAQETAADEIAAQETTADEIAAQEPSAEGIEAGRQAQPDDPEPATRAGATTDAGPVDVAVASETGAVLRASIPAPTAPGPPDPATRATATPPAHAAPSGAGGAPHDADDRDPVGSAAPTRQSIDPITWLYGRVKTWVTTGNAPVKVGVLVSLIGVGLLLREAGQRGLISVTIEMRLAAVALFGLALLAIGWRLRLRNPIYGLSLQGGAVAVLYLTTYASFAVYDVLGAAPAAVAVIAVTVGAGVLAVSQDSRPLAVLGIIGGFLAPVLTYSQPEDHVTVLGFYAVLSAAILAVAWYKTWPELNLLGLAFTFSIAAFWLWRRFDEDDWPSVQPLIAVLVLLYLAIPVLFAIREAPQLRRAWTATLVFATPFMGFGVQYLAVGHTSHGSEASALALALAHGALWVAARRLGRECRQLAEAYAGIAVTFSVIAVPLAFDSYVTATVWAAQGCLLVWAGCRRKQMLAVAAGSLLQILAAASFGYHLQAALPYSADTAVIANGFLAGAAMLAVSSMASGWMMHGARERLKVDPSVPWIALIWGVGWWITGGLMEIMFQMSAQRLSTALVFVVASFGAASAVSDRVRWPHLNALGVLILPTLWGVALMSLAIQSHPLDRYGWAAWPLSIVVFYWWLRSRESLFPALVTTLHAGAYWLVALLVSMEVYWQTDQAAAACGRSSLPPRRRPLSRRRS